MGAVSNHDPMTARRFGRRNADGTLSFVGTTDLSDGNGQIMLEPGQGGRAGQRTKVSDEWLAKQGIQEFAKVNLGGKETAYGTQEQLDAFRQYSAQNDTARAALRADQANELMMRRQSGRRSAFLATPGRPGSGF